MIKVNDELAGFVFIDLTGIIPEAEYFVSEFFIMAKFQGHGVGQKVREQFKSSDDLKTPENPQPYPLIIFNFVSISCIDSEVST